LDARVHDLETQLARRPHAPLAEPSPRSGSSWSWTHRRSNLSTSSPAVTVH
jgi:hypothetical protein